MHNGSTDKRCSGCSTTSGNVSQRNGRTWKRNSFTRLAGKFENMTSDGPIRTAEKIEDPGEQVGVPVEIAGELHAIATLSSPVLLLLQT